MPEKSYTVTVFTAFTRLRLSKFFRALFTCGCCRLVLFFKSAVHIPISQTTIWGNFSFVYKNIEHFQWTIITPTSMFIKIKQDVSIIHWLFLYWYTQPPTLRMFTYVPWFAACWIAWYTSMSSDVKPLNLQTHKPHIGDQCKIQSTAAHNCFNIHHTFLQQKYIVSHQLTFHSSH